MRWVLIDSTGGATTSDGTTLTPESLEQLAAIATIYANTGPAEEYGGSPFLGDPFASGLRDPLPVVVDQGDGLANRSLPQRPESGPHSVFAAHGS